MKTYLTEVTFKKKRLAFVVILIETILKLSKTAIKDNKGLTKLPLLVS